jgi:arylsulfatase A-like enzyme
MSELDHSTEQPNILWICTDQQRYDTIGALGNPFVHTPVLDRLVAEGVAFSHAYCQSPTCTPSRASFMTGMYSSSVHGCGNGNERWSGAAPLVSKLLVEAGYDAGLVGKLHLAGTKGRVEPRGDDGYRIFEWSHSPRDSWEQGHDYADWLQERGEDLAELAQDQTTIPIPLRQTMWCAERAEKFIEQSGQAPWLLNVNLYDPHPRGAEFTPPREIYERYEPEAMPGPLFRESDLEMQARLAYADFQTEARRPEEFDANAKMAGYYALVELVDMAIGRLLDSLERSGQRERTIVVFTSDHGEMLGDHGLLKKGCRFYEGLVRVPLIISWPGTFAEGVISEALVELTDIAPTLLQAGGASVPERMQGRSLLPILTGALDPHRHREFVRSEYYRALNPDQPKRLGQWTGTYATMLRDERYKLVVYHGHELGELYDLQEDPGEFDNRWDDPAFAPVLWNLMKQSFDALAFAVDLGPKQVTSS